MHKLRHVWLNKDYPLACSRSGKKYMWKAWWTTAYEARRKKTSQRSTSKHQPMPGVGRGKENREVSGKCRELRSRFGLVPMSDHHILLYILICGVGVNLQFKHKLDFTWIMDTASATKIWHGIVVTNGSLSRSLSQDSSGARPPRAFPSLFWLPVSIPPFEFIRSITVSTSASEITKTALGNLAIPDQEVHNGTKGGRRE